jgi:hypothetical protein
VTRRFVSPRKGRSPSGSFTILWETNRRVTTREAHVAISLRFPRERRTLRLAVAQRMDKYHLTEVTLGQLYYSLGDKPSGDTPTRVIIVWYLLAFKDWATRSPLKTGMNSCAVNERAVPAPQVMTSISLRNRASVSSLLAATLYQETLDMNHKLWNIESTVT